MRIPSKATDPAFWFLALLLFYNRKTHLTKTKEAPGSLLPTSWELHGKRKKFFKFGSREANYDVRYPLNVVWWGDAGLGLGSSPMVPVPGKLIPLHVCIHPYPNANPDPELIQ